MCQNSKQDPDFMGGRDWRSQNDAPKNRKANPPQAENKGVNPSIVLGKACETQNAAVETACKQNACQSLRQDPGCMGGRDFRDQNGAKGGRKRGRKSQHPRGKACKTKNKAVERECLQRIDARSRLYTRTRFQGPE